MNVQQSRNKHGGILLMAMLMTLAFSILAIGLFKLFDTDAMETISVEHHRRAFWMAEAGLEEVMDRLVLDEFFRNNPGLDVPYTVNYSEGSFSNASYTIESVAISPVGGTGDVYSVVSRGDVGSMNRRLQMDILVRPGGPHALRSMRGNVEIDSNVYIDGDVFVDLGDVAIQSKENLNPNNPTGIDGFLVAGGTVSGKGAGSVNTIQMSPPLQPSVDMGYWQPFLNNVNINPNTDGFFDYTTSNYVDEVFISTGVSNYSYLGIMQSGKKMEIDGTQSGTNNFHYLVSATGILFDNWITLRERTIIIADGDVTFDQHMETYNDCVVFATGDIYVRQASSASGVGATLIAMGDIELEQNAIFTGIIFAEGEVDIGSNAEITGTIIGGDGISLDSNVEVTFDPDVFLNPLPGINNVWSQANLAPLQWSEIAPGP
jgi:hypothetical protein